MTKTSRYHNIADMFKGCSFISGLLFLCICWSAIAGAQDNTFKSILQRSQEYSNTFLKEKVYMSTDKNFYLAGEVIWFKIFCLNGNNNHPINDSKVAYAEIIDRNNKAILQAKVILSLNGGNGSFYLPLTINSDNYTIRAYTSWMKNAGSPIFFEKSISIVNTIKNASAQPTVDTSREEVTFFPEGGYLVDDIQTKVAFKISGKDGKGLAARGIVIDNIGDTVLEFSPHRFGIGHFSIKPESGKTYRAIILLPGGRYLSRDLPHSEASGYIINVTDDNAGHFEIRLKARKMNSGQTGENVLLLVHSHQSPNFYEQRFLSYNSDQVFNIDKRKLQEGVNVLTLFNQDKQPVCERLVYIKPTSGISASVQADSKFYSPRQPVELSINLSRGGQVNSMMNCSVSVFQLDSLQVKDDINIVTYTSLLSDLKGVVESPAFYFSDSDDVSAATDDLMLTHGWRRFNWGQVLENKPLIKFLPEFQDQIISGRVVNVNTGAVVANADCFLTVPSNPFGFYINRSDSIGIVRFDTKDYYGPGELIPQVAETNRKNYRIDLFSPFSDDAPLSYPSSLSLNKKMGDALLRKSIAMQTLNIYRADSIRKFIPPVQPDTLAFYGKAELNYYLDDYKRFTTMEEVLREYVTNVNVTLRGGQLYMSMFDDESRQIYHDNILVLVDGVPINDYNKVFSYDPLKVKKLEVVPRRYLYGTKLFSGIVSFETYDGKFEAFDLDPSLVAVDYEGLQLQREFYSPDYTNGIDSRIPDLRTTLFWEPDLNIGTTGNANLKFFSADTKGKFLVVVEGITKEGRPVYGTTGFTVN